MDDKGRIALLMGFASSLAQIVVIRQLFTTLAANDLSMGLALGGWMAATGTGIIAAGRIAANKHNLAIAILIGAAMVGPSVFIARSIPYFTDSWGVLPGLIGTIAAIFISCIPFAGAYGVQLSLILRVYERSEGNIVRGYYMDSLGDVMGGAMFTILFAGVLDNFQAALLSAIALVIAATLCEKKAYILTLVCAIFILAFNASGPMHLSSAFAYPGYDHIDVVKSMYGEVFVGATEGGKSIFFNGRPAISHGDPVWGQQAALLPLMQAEQDADILLIGSFDADIVEPIMQNNTGTLDIVLRDHALGAAVMKHLPELFPKDNANIIQADGRMHVMASAEEYDIIIVDIGDPDDAITNSYYTREFFRGVKRALKKGGILAVGCGAQENYLGQERSKFNADIHATLKDSFPSVLAIPASKTLFLASERDLKDDIVELAKNSRIRGEFVSPQYLRAMIEETRENMLINSLSGGSVNTDLKPIAYISQLRLWIRSSGDGMNIMRIGLLLAVITMAALFVQSPAKSAVFTSSFLGTVTQTTLLLAFQAFHGHIYRFLGLLTAAFMAGLAMGAKNASDDEPLSSLRKDLALFGAYCLFLSVGLSLATRVSENIIFLKMMEYLVFPILCIMTGYIVGMVFAHAAHSGAGTNGVVSSLYGNDLLGGSIGSVVSCAFLIPFFGMPQTLAIAAAIACISYLRLWLQ